MSQELALRQPTEAEITQAKLPARYEAACRAIAECERIDELKDIADRQAALAAYARQAKDDQLKRLALRIQARADRRCGELLKQIPRADDRTRYGQDGAVPPVTRTAAATAAGLSERQRKTVLRVANVPQADFDRALESDSPPTITQLAERGMISRGMPAARSATAAPAATAAEQESAAEAQSAIAAFAEFCDEHDAERIAQALCRADAQVMREHIVHIGEWLDAFISGLSAKSAAA